MTLPSLLLRTRFLQSNPCFCYSCCVWFKLSVVVIIYMSLHTHLYTSHLPSMWSCDWLKRHSWSQLRPQSWPQSWLPPSPCCCYSIIYRAVCSAHNILPRPTGMDRWDGKQPSWWSVIFPVEQWQWLMCHSWDATCLDTFVPCPVDQV